MRYKNAMMKFAVRQLPFSREHRHGLKAMQTEPCVHFPSEQVGSKRQSRR